MVTTGFSRIHVALYANNAGVVNYSGVRELARAKSMEISVTTTDANDYYTNNKLSETEPASFSSGSANIGVDGLTGEEEALILGIKESTIKVGDAEVPVIKYGKNMNPPYMGIGGVKEMQLNGERTYRPIVLTKAKFGIPADNSETREKNINWQNQSLSATLMRDDTEEENWKIIPKENFPTEQAAVDFIVAVLGGAAAASVNVEETSA